MVPDPRTWLRGPRRALRQRRWLAVILAVAVGVGALATAQRYAHPSLHEYVLLPLGVGGFVYYVAHYESAWWGDEPASRGFLRNVAMLLLALAYVGEEAPLVDGLVSQVTALSVVLFVMVSAAVSASAASSDDGDDTGSTPVSGDDPSATIEPERDESSSTGSARTAR